MSNNAMDYATNEARQLIGEMRAGIGGLISQPDMGGIVSLQPGRMPDAECACVTPTNCFRSVSQRSLNVPTIFSSAFVTIPANTDFLPVLISGAITGAVPNITDDPRTSVVFNNANQNDQRARIEDMVLFGLRATVNVMVLDASPVAAGAINTNLNTYLENIISQSLYVSLFHRSDKRDPWMDQTQLAYFRKEKRFWPVPPLKWLGRDPAMVLSLRANPFGNDSTLVTGLPTVRSTVREFDMKVDINVEALFLPDPKTCGPYWPGKLCPKNTIGLTPYYDGKTDRGRATEVAV